MGVGKIPTMDLFTSIGRDLREIGTEGTSIHHTTLKRGYENGGSPRHLDWIEIKTGVGSYTKLPKRSEGGCELH